MRVIAGSARSLPLKTIKGDKTRPTTDRIKETIFNILNPYLYGANFLDLFSGSGGIGIEALSRGAKSCVFIDKSREATSIINQNLKFTRLDENATVLTADVADALVMLRRDEPFDVVYVDPPYGNGVWKEILALLNRLKFIDNNTLIVVEEDLSDDIEEGDVFSGFEVTRIKQYRKNRHIFFKRITDE